MSTTLAPGDRTAREIFAPIASNYDRWSAVLSMGQDPRWRAAMVARLDISPDARVLDVAAGTGLITRLVGQRAHQVVSLDVSAEMLGVAHRRGAAAVLATAERLPFADASFDALTFGYLLRYVPAPLDAMRELARVLQPGGTIGMVEFGRPRGIWRPLWWLFTRFVLPAAGAAAGRGWSKVGRFLGPSIDAFVDRYPDDEALTGLWEAAGLIDIHIARPSLGGGLLMWGRRP
ncbi:MAG: methyltransferase domain-containing protein [Dehalococcoidia bacterium]|nr:MAG: methyltransferase domain-containing protein [Dehalococcoidia bacterium]